MKVNKTIIKMVIVTLSAQIVCGFCGYLVEHKSDCCGDTPDGNCNFWSQYTGRECCMGPGTKECKDHDNNMLVNEMANGHCGGVHTCCGGNRCEGGNFLDSVFVPVNTGNLGQECS